MTKPARTAPFEKIRKTPITKVSDIMARTITHTVEIPGLTRPDGSATTVDVTYTIDEIAEDWVSVVQDFEFADGTVVYGNHPAAVGPLRQLLPLAYPTKRYPAHPRTARDQVISVMVQHNLGGWCVTTTSGRTLEYRFPQYQNGLQESTSRMRARYFALLREYIPFAADLHLDEERDVIVIRPQRETERKEPVVRIA